MCSYDNQRGQVLPLIAICLTVLMGFAGMAVDVGYLQYEQRQQQSAADAGALGGAEYLLKNGCTSAGTGWSDQAKADTSKNGYTDGSGSVVVTVAHPASTGPFASDACSVQVHVASPHPTFFAKLFGMPGDITTEAVATISANNNGCAYYLDPNNSTTFNGPDIQAPGCSIYTNNKPFSIKGGKTVTVAGLGYSQTLDDTGGTKYPEASPNKVPPVTDPCQEIPGCAALQNNPPSVSPCTHPPVANGVMSPGCYTTDFAATTGSMTSGLYVIAGDSSNNSHQALTGSGVTIYVGPNGRAPSPNGTSWTLSPPTSGSYKGVVYYQYSGPGGNCKNGGNSYAQTFDGTAVYMNGLVYAPCVNGITYNGQTRLYSVLVFGSATYNGNKTTITLVQPAPGQSLIQNAVLGE